MKKYPKKNLNRPAGFILIVTLSIMLFNACVPKAENTRKVLEELTTVWQPGYDAMAELRLNVVKSKGLLYYWINYPSTDDMAQKNELRKIQSNTIPILKKRLIQVKQYWSEQDQKELEEVFKALDELVAGQQSVMEDLNSLESYQDMMIRMEVNETMESGGYLSEQFYQVEEQVEHMFMVVSRNRDRCTDKLFKTVN